MECSHCAIFTGINKPHKYMVFKEGKKWHTIRSEENT
jgi:hypothetical protein